MFSIYQYFNFNTFFGVLTYSILVVFICWLFSRLLRVILFFFLKRHYTSRRFGITSIKFTRNSLRFVFAVLAFSIIIATVPVFRKKADYFFSGAGILAAIIGFAAKDAISNLIAGLFIVLFRPFRIGDYIKLDADRSGIVEDITLRHTTINNFENKRLIIPNSIISTESVLNHTIDEAKVLSFNNFLIGIYADIKKAKTIIEEEASKLEFVIDNRTPEEVLNDVPQFDIRVVDVTETAIHIRAYIWLSEPLQEFRAKCNLKERVHIRFTKEGIELPIPVRYFIDK